MINISGIMSIFTFFVIVSVVVMISLIRSKIANKNDKDISDNIKNSFNKSKSSRICEYCSSTLNKDADKCPNCGAKVNK